ncbi:MAG: N-6 DNA methylase, partial [Rhabdochlamydiaceae bacterium]
MSIETMLAPTRYRYVADEKLNGATFTPSGLAGFVAQQIVPLVPKNRTPLRILDPAVGEGSLLVSLLQELSVCGISDVEVYGFDKNLKSLRMAEGTIQNRFPQIPIYFRASDFLEHTCHFGSSPSLFDDQSANQRYDVIIANQP